MSPFLRVAAGRRSVIRRRVARTLAGVVALVALGGCRTAGYLGHVASGQARILFGRVPLPLDADRAASLRPPLSKEERASLAILDSARSYAKHVGLSAGARYTEFFPGDPTYAVWVLTASPTTAPILHRWKFPIVGEVPYLGFFDLGSVGLNGYAALCNPCS